MSRKIIPGAIALACAAALAAPALAATKTVEIKDFSFGPSRMTINSGTTVVWHWDNTEAPHNVTSYVTPKGAHSFRSGTFSGERTYRHRFSRRGTFRFVCSIHPSTMRMRITVR